MNGRSVRLGWLVALAGGMGAGVLPLQAQAIQAQKTTPEVIAETRPESVSERGQESGYGAGQGSSMEALSAPDALPLSQATAGVQITGVQIVPAAAGVEVLLETGARPWRLRVFRPWAMR